MGRVSLCSEVALSTPLSRQLEKSFPSETYHTWKFISKEGLGKVKIKGQGNRGLSYLAKEELDVATR